MFLLHVRMHTCPLASLHIDGSTPLPQIVHKPSEPKIVRQECVYSQVRRSVPFCLVYLGVTQTGCGLAETTKLLNCQNVLFS